MKTLSHMPSRLSKTYFVLNLPVSIIEHWLHCYFYTKNQTGLIGILHWKELNSALNSISNNHCNILFLVTAALTFQVPFWHSKLFHRYKVMWHVIDVISSMSGYYIVNIQIKLLGEKHICHANKCIVHMYRNNRRAITLALQGLLWQCL